MPKKFICSNCGYLGRPETQKKGSERMEMMMWWCFLLPGFIYSTWRIITRYKVCPECKSPYVVPVTHQQGVSRIVSAGGRIFRSFGKSGHTKYGAKLIMTKNEAISVVTKAVTRPRDSQNNKTDKRLFSRGKGGHAWQDSNLRPRDQESLNRPINATPRYLRISFYNKEIRRLRYLIIA